MSWPRILRITGGSDNSVYLTRVHLLTFGKWGGLYLHIFHRPDADPDPHDHPWAFWTFPLRQYNEVVFARQDTPDQPGVRSRGRFNVVGRFRLHYRPLGYTHRVVSWHGYPWKRCWTLVWHGRVRSKWGFYPQGFVGSPDLGAKPISRVFMPCRAYIAMRGGEPLE